MMTLDTERNSACRKVEALGPFQTSANPPPSIRDKSSLVQLGSRLRHTRALARRPVPKEAFDSVLVAKYESQSSLGSP